MLYEVAEVIFFKILRIQAWLEYSEGEKSGGRYNKTTSLGRLWKGRCISSDYDPETLTSVPLLLAFLLKLVLFFLRLEAFSEFCEERREDLSSGQTAPELSHAEPCRR